MARKVFIAAGLAAAFLGLPRGLGDQVLLQSAAAHHARNQTESCWQSPTYRVIEGVMSDYSICFAADGTWSGHIVERVIETGVVEAAQFWGHWRQVDGTVILGFDPRSNGAGEVCRLEPARGIFRVAQGCALKGVVFKPK